MTDTNSQKKFKVGEIIMKTKSMVVAGVAAVLAVVGLIGSINVVPTGMTGVKVRMGQVQEETLSSGIHFKIPFIDSVKKVNNKQEELTYSGQCWGESKEQTPVYYENVVITYQIAPSASVWLYSNIDKNFIKDGSALIPIAMVSSALKDASVTLDTRDVTKRGMIEPLAAKELQEALNEKYGDGNVTVVRVTIENADFEQAYNDVIAERQAAQIKYEQQEIENKTTIEKAKADAEAVEVKAQAEANAKIMAAEAEAEANRKVRESLTNEILANNMITKWNGELPKVQGSDSDFMFDASSFIENSTTETKSQSENQSSTETQPSSN